MAAHRRLDRRRDGLCAGGLRKRAWNAVCSFSILQPPKRIGLRSNIRLSGVLVKNVLDYVSRRFNAYSAGLKSRLGSLTFAEAPLSAISRFNWSPESVRSEAAVQTRLVRMVPRSVRIWSSQPK